MTDANDAWADSDKEVVTLIYAWLLSSSDDSVLTADIDTWSREVFVNVIGTGTSVLIITDTKSGTECTVPMYVLSPDYADFETDSTNYSDGLWIGAIPDQTYSGTKITPAMNVYHGMYRLSAGKDYTLTYFNNVNASEKAMVTVKYRGNYSGTQTAFFTILPANMNDAVVIPISIPAKKSKGEYVKQMPSPVITFNGKKLKKDRDFMVKWPDLDDGAYSRPNDHGWNLIITGIGNFSGEIETKEYIAESSINIAKATVSGLQKTYIYNGTSLVPNKTEGFAPVFSINGKTLTEGCDYVSAYYGLNSTGVASAVFSGLGNGFVGTKRVTFSIVSVPTSLSDGNLTAIIDGKSVSVSNGQATTSITYTAGGMKPAIALLGSDGTTIGKENYTVKYSTDLKKMIGKITINAKGKLYSGTVQIACSIEKADIGQFTVECDDFTYSTKENAYKKNRIYDFR